MGGGGCGGKGIRIVGGEASEREQADQRLPQSGTSGRRRGGEEEEVLGKECEWEEGEEREEESGRKREEVEKGTGGR